MLHRAPVAKPEDVAWFLASYARDAKARVEEAELSALETEWRCGLALLIRLAVEKRI